MAKLIAFAAVLMMLLAACVASAQQTTSLKNGVYTTVHLVASTPEYLDINLRNNHKGVTTFVTTYGCDAIVTLYASTKPQPSASNNQWSLNVNISSSAFLDIEQRQLNGVDQLYYSLVTAVTSPCSAFFVSHVKHSLNLIQLEDSIPQFGAFQPNSQVPSLYHFLEYDLGEADSRLDSLMVLVTNHHTRKTGDESTYNVFVSNTNSRPIEGKAQWSGISTSNGDSALVINKQDPKFVNGGKYWIGIEFKPSGPFAKREDSHYSVVVHPNFAAQRSGFDKPIILLQKESQFGFVPQGSFIYFALYVDKSVAGRILNVDAKTEYGDILMYASTKTTRPDRNNYEFRGGKRVEFKYDQPTFVYVAVEALPHASGFAAFEAIFNRL